MPEADRSAAAIRRQQGFPPTNGDQAPPSYDIHMHGVTADGHSCLVEVDGFCPYFFLRMPEDWWRGKSTASIKERVVALKNDLLYTKVERRGKYDPSTRKQSTYMGTVVPYRLRDHLQYMKLVWRQDFWGFSNGTEFPFIKVRTKSLALFSVLRRHFADHIKSQEQAGCVPGLRFALYESNIDPVLRFIHERNIAPCGWVCVPAGSYTDVTARQADGDGDEDGGSSAARVSYHVRVAASAVRAVSRNKIAPLLVAAFDIECTSSHGDFPVAKKGYQKLATDLVAIRRSRSIGTRELVEALFTAFTCGDADLGGGHVVHRLFPKDKVPREVLRHTLERHAAKILDHLHTSVGSSFVVEDADEEDCPASSQQASKAGGNTLVAYLNKALPRLQGDPIIQIGTTVHRYGSDEIIYRHIATLGTCDPIEGASVEALDTEEEVLLAWKEFIQRLDPDIVAGYNVFGFDMEYMWLRAEELGIEDAFATGLGRMEQRRCVLDERRLSSSALGDNIMRSFDMDGVVLIDMLKVMQRDHKLDSYKLDNVARVFLGDQKDDLKPHEIFERFKGTSTDRCVVARYCLQDCALVNRLLHKLRVLENNVSMGNVCSVPLSYLFIRGQGVKIFSLVAKECRANGIVIPALTYDTSGGDDDTGYEGAIVLEPKQGMYLDDPITVLDYASLYPASMIERNLSHDCFVMDDDRYGHLDGITYTTVSYDVYEGTGDKKTVAGQRHCKFAQLPDGRRGIIPSILMQLLQARKNTRKMMAYETLHVNGGDSVTGVVREEGDTLSVCDVEKGTTVLVPTASIQSRGSTFNVFEQAVLDALQLAYKITANSLYGQIGARTSPVYCKDIAASTTATGRERILQAKAFVEGRYGAEVVYGDSVPGYTPVLVMHGGLVLYETIEGLAAKYGSGAWVPCVEQGKQDKEACELEGVYSWTDDGWTRMHRVIRHALAPHKRIVRVNTHWGVVDVTDDHSLLDPHGAMVSPAATRIGDKLMHSAYPELPHAGGDHGITAGEARIMGFFCGGGSCGEYSCVSGNKSSWALKSSDIKLQCQYKALCEAVYPDYQWNILDTLKSSGVYKLVPLANNNYGAVIKLVEKYRELMYDGAAKIVPPCILNAPCDVRLSFWQGLYDADGDKEGIVTRIDQESQISMAAIALLGASLGYDISLNTREDKPNIYRLNLTKSKQRKCGRAVTKMCDIPYAGYVYDLTTENHHFSAGVGRMVVHNTDSIFVKFPAPSGVRGKEALPYAIKAGQRASAEIQPELPAPQRLEYEKTFYPFILFSKKRYVGNLYEDDPDKPPKQKSMGIVLKRRDNAPIVKKLYGGVLDILLNRQDLNASVEFLKQQLASLVAGDCPLEDLIITKTLRAEYKDPTKIAHKVLAERMGERDTGNKPAVNERVPYVYIRPPPGVEVRLQGDRIEHPDYIREHNLQPDYRFYITNQIMVPICQLYALCVDQVSDYDLPPEYWDQMDIELSDTRLYSSDHKRADRIHALKNKCVERLLFDAFLCRLDPVAVTGSGAKRVGGAARPCQAGEAATAQMTLSVTAEQIKRGKQYECVAKLAGVDGEVVWSSTSQHSGTKAMCVAMAMQAALLAAREQGAGAPGLSVKLDADKAFVRMFKQAISEARDLTDQIRLAAAQQDVGKIVELQDRIKLRVLVELYNNMSLRL